MSLESFDPIAGKKPKVLILGSMPSAQSLQKHQYYGHPQNAFWWIMSQVLNFSIELGYAQKVSNLKVSGIAVWDVLHRCQRPGSLDANIMRSTEEPNDIVGFLTNNISISLIVFNGGAAHTIFKRHNRLLLNNCSMLQLPSTSPAHARVTKQEKLQVWKSALLPHLELN